MMTDKSSKLKETIQKMVKEQILKSVPIIKESILKSLEKEIKYQISEAVNEKLIKILAESGKASPTMRESKKSISSVFSDDDATARKQEAEEARMKIKARILSEQNSMLAGIYDDIVSESHNHSTTKYAPGVIPPEGALTAEGYVDDNSEGVNLDSFPEFTRRLR